MSYDEIDDIREVRGDWSGQLVATAIHAGHGLRADVAVHGCIAGSLLPPRVGSAGAGRRLLRRSAVEA